MKRWASLLLALLMLLPRQALAEERTLYFCGEYKYCLLEDQTAEIISYGQITHDLVIPEELDGHRVTSIFNGAFSRKDYLHSVVIPEGVTAIKNNAFDNCKNLKSVRIPSTVNFIGDYAFANCRSLAEISIPDGVPSIGYAAFTSCVALERIVLPDSVTSIGGHAFGYCNSLEAVNIPRGVASIGTETFIGCNFTGIVIPDTVTSIGMEAFAYCHRLTEIVIPDSVTFIGEKAFCGCENLASIRLPAGDAEIGKDAFLDTAWTLGARELIPDSFDGAADFRDTGWIFPEGAKLYTDSPDLYGLLPGAMRTMDGREADYVLAVRTRRVARSDYSGSANNTITELFLCGRDGTVAMLCSVTHSPPLFGRVKIGQSLDGSAASAGELWEAIRDCFPPEDAGAD